MSIQDIAIEFRGIEQDDEPEPKEKRCAECGAVVDITQYTLYTPSYPVMAWDPAVGDYVVHREEPGEPEPRFHCACGAEYGLEDLEETCDCSPTHEAIGCYTRCECGVRACAYCLKANGGYCGDCDEY